ncbi:MAG: glycoside hydrolase family 13 protein [Bacilli bacterium]
MKEIVFNPINKYHKNPVGAVKKSDVISITIHIIKEYDISDCRIVIHKDFTNDYKVYSLSKIEEQNEYHVYQTNFQIEEIGIFWYHFEFCDCYGKHFISNSDSLDAVQTDDKPSCWQLSIHAAFSGKLNWYKGKIVYQIFPDRFYNGGIDYVKDYAVMHQNWYENPYYKPQDGEILNNDFFGGDLKGIIKKLDYLKSLNVGMIYLNPIFTAYSNHKYDTANYLEVDPMFGTEEDFRELCEAAQVRGMKIILDGVFNHTGSDSIYFNKYNRFASLGAYQSKKSPYYNWYQFKSFPNSYECWWNFRNLPALNQKCPDYIEFITGKNGVLNKWLNLGASGWRFDVIDELEDEFIEKIKQTVKANHSENILIGEVWEDASNKMAYHKRRSYFSGEQIDSVMNYPFRKAIIDYIMNNNYIGLRDSVRTIINNYPKHVLDSLMNILSTHDTVRLLTKLSSIDYHFLSKEEQASYEMSKEKYYSARQKLKMATALQYTLPGVPSIFYGDEVGLQGFKDPFCRKCMPWDRFDETILDWFVKLGKIRQNRVYVDGAYQEEICEQGIFAFSRTKGSQKVVTIVNNSHYDYVYKLEKGFDLINEVKIEDEVVVNAKNALIIMLG